MSQAIDKILKRADTHGPTHHNCRSGFSRNAPSTMLLDNRPSQMYLQPKHQCMHGCGVNHFSIGEIVSSPSQYKIY
jgi:hypothetical protein